MRRIWLKLRELFTVKHEDADLLHAQYRIFVRQIPLLYFILAVNTMAVIYTFAPYGRPWITIYLPSLVLAVICVRGVIWWRRGEQETTAAVALQRMRSSIRLAAAFAAGFTLWGFLLYGYGDAYAKGQIVFFLALTMIACVFSLTYLLPAALTVTGIGVVPFGVYFFFQDDGRFRAVAVNLTLVAIGMVATILRNYNQFARFVASQRAFLVKHDETLRLADENSRLANIDALTELPNRRHFIARLGALCDDLATGEIAMAFVDLDGFK